MSAAKPIKIDREELFTKEVDEALAREKALRGRVIPPSPPVSLLRRVLLSNLFYLPAAALIGAVATWLVLEPYIGDQPRVAGEVILVNSEPFDATAVSMTVGSREVFFVPSKVAFEPGRRGQQPFPNLGAITPGTAIDVVGVPMKEGDDNRILAVAVRPATEQDAREAEEKAAKGRGGQGALYAFFPLSATLIALGLLFAEGVSTRNWRRTLDRCLLGTLLAVIFTFLSFIPAGLVLKIGHSAFEAEAAEAQWMLDAGNVSREVFLLLTICRSAAWAFLGVGLGLGMNMVRSTSAQLRNSVVGGALGGALGGLFFDPIDRFGRASPYDQAGLSRLVGVCAVGLSVGLFVALAERLTREAWIRVRTGPLAGKSFILYRTPTTLGSSPQSDIYLFKDAAIDPSHASIHRVGLVYEIEDLESREGTEVGGHAVHRQRLVSGDQIVVGSTVLEFEERARRPGLTAKAQGRVA